ncbi:MAG: hypothetical protein ACK4UJ_06630 [Leptonema sp. (in: bacteria)]
MEIKEKKVTDFKKDYFLPLKPIGPFFPDVILNQEFLLFGDSKSKFSVFVDKEDFAKEEFWNFIKLFYNLNLIKIAKWWDFFLKEIEPTGFFLTKNWKDNYKTRSDWEEWKSFRKNSELLYEMYEFSIQIIRLWDRLDTEIQTLWLKILEIIPIKRNLLKEIIMDLYDLKYDQQIYVSKKNYEYVLEKKEKNEITIETQEILRENVKNLRYPKYYQRKKESYFLKKRIESLIKLKNLEIAIPEDLESKPIELKFYLYSDKDLDTIIEKISEPMIIKNMKELMGKVFQEL